MAETAAAPAGYGKSVLLSERARAVGHVLGKLGAANRTEAVARGRDLGLIG